MNLPTWWGSRKQVRLGPVTHTCTAVVDGHTVAMHYKTRRQERTRKNVEREQVIEAHNERVSAEEDR